MLVDLKIGKAGDVFGKWAGEMEAWELGLRMSAEGHEE